MAVSAPRRPGHRKDGASRAGDSHFTDPEGTAGGRRIPGGLPTHPRAAYLVPRPDHPLARHGGIGTGSRRRLSRRRPAGWLTRPGCAWAVPSMGKHARESPPHRQPEYAADEPQEVDVDATRAADAHIHGGTRG